MGGTAPHGANIPVLQPQVARALEESVRQSPQEFEASMRTLAARRRLAEKAFDDLCSRMADEHHEALWQAARQELGRLVAAELGRPHPEGGRALTPAYIKESIDPRHRAGFLLAKCLETYEAIKPPTPFFEWLDQLPELERINLLRRDFSPDAEAARRQVFQQQGLQGLAARGLMTLQPSQVVMLVNGVRYLDDVARQSYALEISAGRFSQGGNLFDTRQMRTVHSGLGWAIFVQSAVTGTFFSASHVLGRFHHSSFLSGAPVRSAGEWRVTCGQLVKMSAKSGHYQPTKVDLLAGVSSLQRSGLDLSLARLVLYRQGSQMEVPALDFLGKPEQFAQYTVWN